MGSPTSHQCFCIGPQGGQPLCPCRMRNTDVVDGRYVEVIDHGPADHEVSTPFNDEFWFKQFTGEGE